MRLRTSEDVTAKLERSRTITGRVDLVWMEKVCALGYILPGSVILIAEANVQRQVRPDPPVVLDKRAEVPATAVAGNLIARVGGSNLAQKEGCSTISGVGN